MPPIREHSLDLSPLSSANSKKGKGKDEVPQPTDPATWRESRIPPDELITSTQAKKWYNIDRSAVLNEISWEPHPFLDPKSQVTSVLFVASHREIERKAWEMHGGPEGWDAYKAHQRELQKSKRQGASSKADGILQPIVEVTPLFPIKHPFATNANLERLYESFISRFHQPWVWNKCNHVLSLAGVSDDAIRESHLENALATLPQYPMKESLQRLRRKEFGRFVLEVLDRAPRKAGIGMEAIQSPYGGILYVWGVPYLTELYNMLNEVIDKHGKVVWRKLRWKVYHTYEECQGGIYFNICDGTWGDPAFKWLAGKTEPGSFIHSERSRCQAGIEYNERLLVDDV